jgi:AraC-like DNA-binding protein
MKRMRSNPTALGHWNTRGREVVVNALAAAYPDATNFALHTNNCEPRFLCSILQLQDLTIRKTSTSGYRCDVAATDIIRVTLPMRSGVAASSSGGKKVAHAAISGLVCADQRVERDVLPGYCGYHFQISRERLVRQARILADTIRNVDRIVPLVDMRSPVGAALCRNVATFFGEAEQLATMGLGPLASASGNDLIVNLAVLALIPGVREQLSEPVNHIGGGLAERARQYLEAHAADPLRLSVVADELGISLRALQLGFRKQFGCAPSEYIFECRLRLARQQLLSASALTTVARVAVDCGFSNVGAFASRYRITFGELPSQTLRRARSLS